MGTSKNIKPGVKNTPNWRDINTSISAIANANAPKPQQIGGFLSSLLGTVGGYQSSGSSNKTSRSKGFGKASVKTATKVMGVISYVNNGGNIKDFFKEKGIDITNKSVNDIINLILDYCKEGNSGLDETAATSANGKLWEKLLENCNDDEDIDKKLISLSDDEKKEWLSIFFAHYIVEYSTQLFNAKIFDKEGTNKTKTFKEIFDYIEERLKDKQGQLVINLSSVNWNTNQGINIITQLQQDIIDIFQP